MIEWATAIAAVDIVLPRIVQEVSDATGAAVNCRMGCGFMRMAFEADAGAFTR